MGLKKVPVLQIMFDQCDDPPNLLCQQNKHRALKTVLNKTNLDKKNVLHLTKIQRYITLQKSWVWSKLDLSKKAKHGKGFFKTKKRQQLNNLKAEKYYQPKNVCVEFHLWSHVMSEKKFVLQHQMRTNLYSCFQFFRPHLYTEFSSTTATHLSAEKCQRCPKHFK